MAIEIRRYLPLVFRASFRMIKAIVFLCFVAAFFGDTIAVSFAEDAKAAQIDKVDLLILIRQTLTALDLSNKSGNYSILREISAPGFAAVNDAARLSNNFKSQRERGVDYSGTLVYEPQITAGPEISKEGLLRFQGFFPSASSQIKFEMMFAPVNGQWKLFGLAADLAPAGPRAPIPAPQAQNPAATNKPADTGIQPAQKKPTK